MDSTKQHQLFDKITDLKIKIREIATPFQNDFNVCLHEGIYDSERLIEMKDDFFKNISVINAEVDQIYCKGMKMLSEAIRQAEKAEGVNGTSN